jgi:Big-like domain-containing protein
MKLNVQSPLLVLLFSIILFFQLSCSKDSDLLADYVLADTQDAIAIKLVVNDNYVLTNNNSIVLDVLSNDTFTEQDNVTIIETSTPTNGNVVVNEDNTLTYTSEETETEEIVSDTFTYTAEVVNEDQTTTTEEGTVTITIAKLGSLKAFPGAEGFGKYATGGRGGIVVEVTNLNDSGPGSLREALKMTETRTIVFKVGGTIKCESYLNLPEGSGNVTIAGQTAPGGGILIKNGELRVSASNVIIRYIRFRLGTDVTSTNLDALKIRSFNPSAPLSDIIVDHCSFSWARDENVAITNAENVTIQNSIIAECAKNFLIQSSKDVSVLNNITCLTRERNIRANTIPHLNLTFEMANNLIYGFIEATRPSEGLKFTVENNIYKHSDEISNTANNIVDLVAPNPENYETNTIINTYAYISGNVIPSGTSLYSTKIVPFLESSALYRSSYVPVSTSGLEEYLLANAGAFPRDAVDSQYIDKIKNKTGGWARNGTFPSILGGEAYTDNDNDGIEDSWEDLYGLSSNDSKDARKDDNGDGYTNLEAFLNSLTL